MPKKADKRGLFVSAAVGYGHKYCAFYCAFYCAVSSEGEKGDATMAKIGIFYDSRRLDKSGKGMVCVSVAAGGQTRYVATGIKVAPQDWAQEVRSTVRMAKALNNAIRSIRARVELKAVEMEMGGGRPNAAAIVAAYKAETDSRIRVDEPHAEPAEQSTSVGAVYRRWMSTKQGKTRRSYASALRSLLDYCPELDSVGFERLSRGWLMEWDRWMEGHGVASPNARAVYHRNLRAVCNYAVDEGVTDNYPYRRFAIRKVETEKRSLSVEEMRAIWYYQPQSYEHRWVTVFKLMFTLIGINAVDLGQLTEVRGGRITYHRSKTKKLYSIKVEPETEALIAEIKGKEHLVNLMDTNKDHETWLRHCNRALRNLGVPIGERLGRKRKTAPIVEGLTTYWARHTWATIAASLDIPKDTIAQALGHGSQTVTDIYIDFDQRKIDDANRRVLDWVLYGKR